MTKGVTTEKQGGSKSWSQLRQEAGLLGIVAIVLWIYAAIALLIYGGVISAICGFVAGVMAWTPSILELRAQGKRTISDSARMAIGLMLFVVSIATFPASHVVATAPAPVASPASPTVPKAQKCAATDRKTNLDMGVQEDGSKLRIAPDKSAKYLMPKLGYEQRPEEIDRTRMIREECRSGSWSRVRVISPSQSRHVAGWVPTSHLVAIKTFPDGRRIYRPADFLLDVGNQGNRVAVVAALNVVLQQNPSCEAYDTASLLISDPSGNPSVEVVCVGPPGDQHFVFNLKDVKEGKTIRPMIEKDEQPSSITTSLSKPDALQQCERATLDKITHPSTADFNAWDTTFEQIGNESRFSIGLTAKNGFGLELKLLSTCVFEGHTLTLNHIAETR